MKITGRRLVIGAAAGALAVSVDEEGRTRARDRDTVAAPTAGRLDRILLRAGVRVSRR